MAMAMRYMKHAPEAYFAEDAAKVAGSLTGQHNTEAAARIPLARTAINGACGRLEGRPSLLSR